MASALALGSLLLSLTAAAGVAGLAGRLDWQPDQAWSEPWRWWTAAWVHHGLPHLAANLLGCAVLAALGWTAGLSRRWAVAWAAAWPATHLALLLQPALSHYGGMSGVLHAGVAVAAAALWCAPARGDAGLHRHTGLWIAGGLLVKVALEQPWRAALRAEPMLGVMSVPLAHAAGAAGWALAAALACAAPKTRRRRDTMRG